MFTVGCLCIDPQLMYSYDRLLIGAIVITAYLGWIVYSATFVVQGQPLKDIRTLDIIAALTLVSFWCSFMVQHSAGTLYIYIVFPVYFWHQAIARAGRSVELFVKDWEALFKRSWKAVVQVALAVVVLLSMVVCTFNARCEGSILILRFQAGYTHRSIWSIMFAAIGVAWPLLFWPNEILLRNRTLTATWAVSCLSTAVFPLLPLHQEENIIAM